MGQSHRRKTYEHKSMKLCAKSNNRRQTMFFN